MSVRQIGHAHVRGDGKERRQRIGDLRLAGVLVRAGNCNEITLTGNELSPALYVLLVLDAPEKLLTAQK